MKKILTLVFLLFVALNASAQFKRDAFQQSYNDDPAKSKDSTDVVFSFKEYWQGLKHEREIKIGTMWGGSLVVIGGEQIYNKQYWKLPIVYTGILAPLGAGIYFDVKGNQKAATWCYVGAGVAYWGTLLDGVINYKSDKYPLPGRATLYSLLVPGLGQAYNGEYWKIPIYLGGLATAFYFYNTNSINYERYRRIYKEATNTEVAYTGPISAETAVYYRDIYRRYRDYSTLAMALIYALQVIDANVFSYMHDFEVADDMAMTVRPAVIMPDTQLAFNPTPAFGINVGIRF